MNKQLIFPINTYEDKVEFACIGNKYGHSNVVFYDIERDKKYVYSNLPSKDQHGWFLSTVSLAKIDNGCYSIYTQNIDESDSSLASNITVLGQTNKENVSTLLSILGKDINSDPYKAIIDDIISNKHNIIESLFPVITSNTGKYDEQTKAAAAITLKYYIDKANKFISQNTSPDNDINIYTDIVSYSEDTVKILDVDISDISNGYAVMPYSIDPSEDNIYIPQDNNTMHLYIFIDDNNDYIDIRFVFKPNEKILQDLWTNEKENKDKYALAIEKTIYYSDTYLSFSEDEQKILSVFEELIPVQPIFKNSKVTYSKGKIHADFSYDFGLMKALSKDFYLSFRELELALDSNTRRRVLINKTTFDFYASTLGITNEPYVVCITDNDNNILSQPYLINLLDIYDTEFTPENDEDSDSAYINIDENDFNEKYRKYSLSKYEKHLKSHIRRYYYDDILNIVKNLYNTIYEDGDTGIVDAPIEITDGACTSMNSTYFFDLCKCMYEDNTVYGSYLVNYFSDNINYYYKENSVRIPPSENTILIFDSYYVDGYMKRDYRDCDTESNSIYRFDDNCSYGVFWALNKNTYARSGFVIIDITQPITRPRHASYLMDTVQAVN